MLISASLLAVLVTETVAPEFSAVDSVAGDGDDEAVAESITDEADGEEDG